MKIYGSGILFVPDQTLFDYPDLIYIALKQNLNALYQISNPEVLKQLLFYNPSNFTNLVKQDPHFLERFCRFYRNLKLIDVKIY